MAKKLSVSFNLPEEYTVIGIACHLKEYRISFQVNEALRIHLKRGPDLIFETSGKTARQGYAWYWYDDHDHRCVYMLLANHHPEGKLLASLKQTDYFLIISQTFPPETLKQMIQRLRKIEGVLTAYLIDSGEVRNMDLLLNDLEMHLMNA